MKSREIDKCIESLERWGYLEYGVVIPASTFETLFETDCEKSWDFLGPLLEIREELTERGFLCTQRDVEFGCLKIYGVDEMIYQADRLFKNTAKRIKKLQMCMCNTRVEEFNDREQKMHMHTSNKINAGLNAMRSILANI